MNVVEDLPEGQPAFLHALLKHMPAMLRGLHLTPQLSQLSKGTMSTKPAAYSCAIKNLKHNLKDRKNYPRPALPASQLQPANARKEADCRKLQALAHSIL